MDGKSDSFPNLDRYVSNISISKDGQGEWTLPNGNVYNGTFSEDKMDGSGTFTWANGKGQFVNVMIVCAYIYEHAYMCKTI